MVVDDEPGIRTLLQHILELAGYQVVSFGDPVLALDYFKKHEVALALIDMHMPNMTGDGLFLAMRDVNPKIKVIVISGYAWTQKVQMMLESGVVKFISKPFNPRELLTLINESL
jgi:DNA-binding NtrC family response regulator